MPKPKPTFVLDFDILDQRVTKLEADNQEQSKSLAIAFERLDSITSKLEDSVKYLSESTKEVTASNHKIVEKMEKIMDIYHDNDDRLSKVEQRFSKRDRVMALLRNGTYTLIIAGVSVVITKLVEIWLQVGN